MILFWIFTALVLLFGFVVAFGAPYVPSLKKELANAFTTLYAVTSNDVVVDLGSGDGQVLVEAARRGAYGYGYELNPMLAAFSSKRLKDKAEIRIANMWHVKIPETSTLVYVFAVSRDSKRLGRYLQVQATQQNRMIRVMTFGSGLVDFTPVAQLKAHSLYEISPKSP